MKKIWTDPEYKKKFKADPIGMLKKEGETKIAKSIEVVEQSNEKFYCIIPPAPKDIDDWAREQLALAERGKCGGSTCHDWASICT